MRITMDLWQGRRRAIFFTPTMEVYTVGLHITAPRVNCMASGPNLYLLRFLHATNRLLLLPKCILEYLYPLGPFPKHTSTSTWILSTLIVTPRSGSGLINGTC
jgi:hypothetical protein